MSNKIEERVVGLKFDNADFAKNVKSTLDMLDKLNKGLKLEGAAKGLTDIAGVARNVSLEHVAQGVDTIAGKFQAMSVIAITALSTITHAAINAGASIARSLTIDPIKTGFSEYETNLNSIQTIMANTQAAGTSLSQVGDALAELNLYSDQTIYNFAEMARNIGTFTAAGVALEPSVAAIKGIANLAALSGSNSMQASTAMYQLSQALSAGRVSLIDWNSVVNAGMGGTVFQRALAQTAVKMGTLNANAVTLSGAMKTVKINGDAFRNTLQDGWLTADVLTNTLAQFTGDLTDAELAAQGFSTAEIEAIQKQAATAKAAATEVKTITQLMGALRESAGSGWAQTWQIVFGDFEEAKELWSGVYKVVDGALGSINEGRNELLRGWKELGGREVLITAVAEAFKVIGQVLAPIGKAFREIFPRKTAEELYRMTVAFAEFTEKLEVAPEIADKLRRIFAGFFAILGIGWDVVKGLIGVVGDLLGLAGSGSGDFLELLARIGDFFVGLRTAIHEGTGLTTFFQTLTTVLAVPIKLLIVFGQLLSKLFESFNGGEAADAVTGFVGSLSPLEKMGAAIAYVWDKVASAFQGVWNLFEPLASRLNGFFSTLASNIAAVTGGLEFKDLLGAINTGAFVTLVTMFGNFVGRNGRGGILGSLRIMVNQVTETLNTMQNTLRAATLLQIALAIGVLTLSISVLSEVDPLKLASALGAISIMFLQLQASLTALEAMPPANPAKIMGAAIAMGLLAIAINILASAVKKLSGIDSSKMMAGLFGVTSLIATIVLALKTMPPAPGLVTTGFALIFIGTAMKIFASAVEDISKLSWGDITRGLAGITAILGALVGFTRFAGPGGILQGGGIVLLATGIKILASALHDIANLSWEEIGKGATVLSTSLAMIVGAMLLIPPNAVSAGTGVLLLATSLGMVADAIVKMSTLDWPAIGRGMTVFAGALGAIALALKLIPPSSLLNAAGVLLVAASLGLIADAFEQMGSNDWGTIGKGMVVLGGALTIIATAMKVMKTALPGAAALFVIATALAILAPVLSTFGRMSWEEIGKGLALVAGFFAVLGVAALVLSPLVPVIFALAGAVALLGVGFALAGVGILAFSAAITALSVAGSVGTVALVAFFSALIGLIPFLAEQLGIAIITLLTVIVEAIPQIIAGGVKILIALLDGFISALPKILEAVSTFVLALLAALIVMAPDFIVTGLKLLLEFLKGFAQNIGPITVAVVDIIDNFLDALGDEMPRLLDAGADFVIEIMKGLRKAVEDNMDDMAREGGRLAGAFIRGFFTSIDDFLDGLSDGLIGAKSWDSPEGKNTLDFLTEWEKAIEEEYDIQIDILTGNVAEKTQKSFQSLGKSAGTGFADGIIRSSSESEAATRAMGNRSLEALRSVRLALDAEMDMTPTITPVLDITGVRTEASKLESILSSIPRMADASYSSAIGALTGFQGRVQDILEAIAGQFGNTINFTQNNNSPKPLNTGEIYRQTNNQLSVAKGVFAK